LEHPERDTRNKTAKKPCVAKPEVFPEKAFVKGCMNFLIVSIGVILSREQP